ncbi:hypothetical protein B0H16DRAFT_1499679 [Mycena metata]|uniref:Uncharacterized protein n=1 Tax=Mycena metata TaxID=1033252 RepID=A0AAD7NY46_9AGAR|nr:hypothetical protein B0H16DRAFT_1499679 [Mycena metata]
MLDHCNNFTIYGGTFNNYAPEGPRVTQDVEPPLSPNFHSIRLGDLNLLKEIGKQQIVKYSDIHRRKTGVLVRRECEVVGCRRIYRASVVGTPATQLTAVIDEGTDLEKWRSEAEKHEMFRHPSLVQLYAVTMSRTIKGLIYADALISLPEIRETYADSPLASSYVEYGIVRCLFHHTFRAILTEQKRDLFDAFKYWETVTKTWLLSPGAPNYTAWIRTSTGRLCIDIGDSSSIIKHLDVKTLVRDPVSRSMSIGYCEVDLERMLHSILQLDDIHVLLCSRANYEATEVSFRSGQVALGTIWPASNVQKITPPVGLLAFPPNMVTSNDMVGQPWWCWNDGLRTQCNLKDVMPTGWTRVSLPPNMDRAHHLRTRVKIKPGTSREMHKCWLSQANSIARECGAVHSYWIPGGVKFKISIWFSEDRFTLRGTFMTDPPPSEVYLFLFRPHFKFVDGYPVISIPCPDEAFYWSFDPQGNRKMTSEEAEEVGVPYVFFESWVTGASWAPDNYDVLSDFHRAKGFDPVSRQIALKLGYPIVGPQFFPSTSLSEVDGNGVEYAKRELKTYPQQDFRRAAVRCPNCGGGRPAIQNVVLPDIEVPPIHRHHKASNEKWIF